MDQTAYGKASLQTQRGWSLYETLITLAVVGTIVVLAVPNFKPVLANQRMSTSVNTLVSALHLSRSEAIHHGQRATLCPTEDGNTCVDSHTEWHRGFMVYIDHNANRQRDEDEPIVRMFQIGQNIQMRSSRGRDHITYQASGLASGSNATFVFCDNSKSAMARMVVVSNGGRPRVLPAQDNNVCG